jgi:hypothetical protein
MKLSCLNTSSSRSPCVLSKYLLNPGSLSKEPPDYEKAVLRFSAEVFYRCLLRQLLYECYYCRQLKLKNPQKPTCGLIAFFIRGLLLLELRSWLAGVGWAGFLSAWLWTGSRGYRRMRLLTWWGCSLLYLGFSCLSQH